MTWQGRVRGGESIGGTAQPGNTPGYPGPSEKSCSLSISGPALAVGRRRPWQWPRPRHNFHGAWARVLLWASSYTHTHTRL